MTFDNPDHYDSLFVKEAGVRTWLKVPLCELVEVDADKTPAEHFEIDAEALSADLIPFKNGTKYTRAEFLTKIAEALNKRITDFAILPYGHTSTPEVSAFLEKYS